MKTNFSFNQVLEVYSDSMHDLEILQDFLNTNSFETLLFGHSLYIVAHNNQEPSDVKSFIRDFQLSQLEDGDKAVVRCDIYDYHLDGETFTAFRKGDVITWSKEHEGWVGGIYPDRPMSLTFNDFDLSFEG